MSDLIERLKGPFKYHDNMLCVPESLIEDCGRALSPALPDDVQAYIQAVSNGLESHPDWRIKYFTWLTESIPLLQRLARENEQLLQNTERLVKSNDGLRHTLGDKRAKIEALEAKLRGRDTKIETLSAYIGTLQEDKE